MSGESNSTCRNCGEMFRNRSAYKNHVRSKHQASVAVKFEDGTSLKIKRESNGKFKCRCGKLFKLPNSLHAHARSCMSRIDDHNIVASDGDGMMGEESDSNE